MRELSWQRVLIKYSGIRSPTLTLINFRTWIIVVLILIRLFIMNIICNLGLFGSNGISFDIDLLNLEILRSNINRIFFRLVRTISIFIFIWSLYYIGIHKITMFYFSLLIFVISILLLTLRNRIFIVFLGWEGLGITSFILIVFYQNWIRAKGGLLTLLTNRIGDAVLLITLCRIMRIVRGELYYRSLFILSIFILLALTKRAQWPFIRWLPAAIAAPTPVRSLVHRSTLVTAGVWLIIRFNAFTSINIIIWGGLGILTLTVARLRALIEVDAKKIVALSTLRQLGLIFIALSLGIPTICFFHILIHALAKANLFIIIGSLLHRRFRQQDSRITRSRSLGSFITLRIRVRLFRLVGLTFISGFYSKEQVITGHSFVLNRIRSNLIILVIISLTLAYCLKLFIRVFTLNPERVLIFSINRITQFSPIFIISRITAFIGFIFRLNVAPCSLIIERLERIYWLVLILGVLVITIRYLFLLYSYNGFYRQLKLIDLGLRSFYRTKTIAVSLESSGSEIIYLFSSYLFIKILKQGVRLIFLFSTIIILLTFI